MLTRMRSCHFIRTVVQILTVTLVIAASNPAAMRAQTPATSTFIVFFRSMPIGNEQVAAERTGQGWTITSSGRIGPPLDLVVRNLTVRYDTDWKPLELSLDASFRTQATAVHTIVTGTTAANETTPFGADPIRRSDQIDERAVLLPNPFIGAYEALAVRLKTASAGERIPVYQPAQGSFDAEVGESTTEQIKTIDRTIMARRTRLMFQLPNVPPLAVEVWGDEAGRLLRVSIPVQSLEFAREDIASVSARLVTMSRPNDEDIRVPANGFSIAGTLSKSPASKATTKSPAVILIGGSGPSDRDETAFGIPIFGQLANVLADAGYLVVRYDKRGVGQSGGRTEVARLNDFAEDARAVIKAISERKDVDRKRIAVVGHSEGGWIAMLAAAKNDRVSALGLISTVAVSGRDLNLYQVTHGVERSGRPEAERQATIDLQKQIQQAVVAGAGWEKLPEGVRRQADTPYFHSFLTHDPAKIMKDVRQPLLIVQGERDTQVPPSNADQLERLAKARKRVVPVEVVKIPGINHLLVPATTGEADEYGSLPQRTVSADVSNALVQWLGRTIRAQTPVR